MLDLAITGATVVTRTEVKRLDVGVSGGVTSIIAEPGSLPAAKETIDGTGLLLLPGGVDPHIHCNPPYGIPNVLDQSIITKAALYGGMTSIIDFVWPGESSPTQVLGSEIEAWAGTSYTDYGFHVVLSDLMSDDALAEIPHLISEGFPSFKIFTTRVTPSQFEGFRITAGTLYEVMKLTAANNGIVTVHAEDDELVLHEYRKHFEAGKTDLVHVPDVHTSMSEDVSFHRVLRLASHVPDARIYFHHVTAAEGVDAVREYQQRGFPVSAETLVVLSLVTSDRYAEEDGVKYHIYPSLREQHDVESLWEGVKTGVIQTFGTDGVCPMWKDKSASRTIDGAWGGVTGVEPKLALLYTEMIQNRGLPLTTLAEVTATNAAEIFGLYPRKGVIAVGSDADYVLFDPNAPTTIDASAMHEGDYTPYGGWRVAGWPKYTVKAGEVVVKDAQLLEDRPTGSLLRRTLPPL